MSHEDHEGHGHSTAAWVSVTVMLLASAFASYGVAIVDMRMIVVGAVVFFVGALLWPLLSRMGYGDKHKPTSPYPEHAANRG